MKKRKVIFDIETNGLENPTEIWVVVGKDVDTGELTIFREVTKDVREAQRLQEYLGGYDLCIGHNILGYDCLVLQDLLGISIPVERTLDTLIISKLMDYSRPGGHSLEDYGRELGLEKITFSNWSKYSQEMEDYCIRDVELNYKVYLKYKKYTDDPEWAPSIKTEHEFQLVVNDLHKNGFAFNAKKAEKILKEIGDTLGPLDKEILAAFPPKLKLIREVTPKETKHGTISLSSIPKALRDSMHLFTVGAPFSYCEWVEFNPSSHRQIIEVLNASGWSPTEKTKTHIETERELNRLRYQKRRSKEFDTKVSELDNKLSTLQTFGWKVNEANLLTLPDSSPPPARLLAKRILLESRRRTLTEWLGLVREDGRIHGKFYAIGAWTHRMAHQNPNTANIPNEFDTQGQKKLYGKEMRSMWVAPRNRLLVGVDAEGIQLRIFAHMIDDAEFTEALVNGKKEDKSDPHSLNQRILGPACKSRQAAKRFIYALLLGGGLPKLAEILQASRGETESALERLMARYQGWLYLKEHVFPTDAERGWFKGLDGRKIRLPGNDLSTRKHLCMSGYLQAGEAVVMKLATLKFYPELERLNSKLVNFVHDEWQTETPNNMEIALQVARIKADSLRLVGEELNLNCPLAGSYWNDDLKDYTIATDWAHTH